MRFLIVEDDFTSRRLLQKILAPFGDCEVAVNGREAVDAVTLALDEGRPYDLICLDIMMPEMDGQEALQLIRQRELERGRIAGRETPVVMVTALDAPRDVVKAYFKGGCTAYLVKPIEKRKVVGLLREHGLIGGESPAKTD